MSQAGQSSGANQSGNPGGAGGSLAIGTTVGGAPTNSGVLFVDSTGKLATNTSFQYDAAGHLLLAGVTTAANPSLALNSGSDGLFGPSNGIIGVTLAGTEVARFGGVGPNVDATFVFGRAQIDARTTNRAIFSHVSQTGATAFALSQTSTGGTTVNAATGQTVLLAVNNASRLTVGGTTMGFQGAAAIAQPVSAANVTNNVTVGGTTDQIDDITSLTVYATDGPLIRNAIYQLARKVKQINDGLRLYGLFT